MKNENFNTERQLSVLFTHLNGENEPSADGAVNILLKWDAGINTKLGSSNADSIDMTVLIQESEQEHQRFRILLMEEMISRRSNLDKHQLIETVSIYFIRLMDILSEFTKSKHLAEPLKKIAKTISAHFQRTFEFIEDFFGSYINGERKAPNDFIDKNKAEIFDKLKKAKTDFITRQDNQSFLIEIVESVIIEKLSGRSSISISNIRYISLLAEEIYQRSKPPHKQNLREILYSINFNEESFVMAEYERFAALIPDTISKKERLQLLRQEQKGVNQIVVKLNCYWDFSMPSLKEQINGWINEEIQFIESGLSSTVSQNRTVENFDKIQTSLSVAKLALIVRLLVIDKIIINRQVAPVLRTTAKVFSTLQKDEISFGSLETKFHAPEKATVTMVRDMLFKWINLLGKL